MRITLSSTAACVMSAPSLAWMASGDMYLSPGISWSSPCMMEALWQAPHCVMHDACAAATGAQPPASQCIRPHEEEGARGVGCAGPTAAVRGEGAGRGRTSLMTQPEKFRRCFRSRFSVNLPREASFSVGVA
jgi:hypothetical protein